MEIWREWRGLLRREFAGYDRRAFRVDLLAALTVAAVALPLALAFGVASGADAAAGLVTAVLSGLVIGALGGAPYQISGPTGAMTAVLAVLASRYGLQGVWITGVLAGVMMIALGVLKLGRVVSLIPAPVISGFTSGIALIIAFGQLGPAVGAPPSGEETVLARLRHYFSRGVEVNARAAAITVAVILIMLLWPRLKLAGHLPGSLLGIVAATLAAALLRWDVPVIGSIPRSILLDQRLRIDAIPWGSLGALIVPAMSVAALGSIESLLCGAVAGRMTGIRLHNSVELVAQGIGNVAIPFFGGVPATAAIARTSVGIKSGARTRLTPILHGVALLLVALLLAPAIGRVPVAALAGVLLVTAWRMNEWHAIHFFFSKRLKHAIIAFLATLLATVLLDLTQAILIGFGVSTLLFMAQISDLHISREVVDARGGSEGGDRGRPGSRRIIVYYLSGPLFFAAARKLVEEIEARDAADVTLVLSLRGVPLVDATGIDVLREIRRRQKDGGGELLLAALAPRVETLLERTGFLEKLGAKRLFASADRAVRSLGAALPEEAAHAREREGLDSTLVITPHEDRAGGKM